MNPLFIVPLFAYAVVATAWPNQIDGRRRGRTLLWVELATVSVALVAGYFLSKLVEPNETGMEWGKAGLYVAVYLYVCGRGATLVRAALEIPPLVSTRGAVVDKEGNPPAPTGLVCPRCKCRYGLVVTVQMKPQVITFKCAVCDHLWYADEPTPGKH